MQSIILSDTSLLGTSYANTKEGINYLQELQDKGNKIIMLSNRPELCMRKIGAFVAPDGKVSYRYLGACDIKGNGVDIVLFNEEGLKEEYKIKSDYTIFGNGIASFDKDDNLIYQGNFINELLLDKMIRKFRENGYQSYGEYASLSQDALGDRCFAGREDVYKFFTPKIGTDKVVDSIYGMQCSSRSLNEDMGIISIIENTFPEIIGYRLNGKPCFYQRDVNKLVSLSYLAQEYGIDVNNALILLNELTDRVILEQYPNSYCIGKELFSSNQEETLSRALRKHV